MGFVILFTAAWAAVFLFYAMEKKLNVLENTFVYLFAMTLGIHLFWIFAEEWRMLVYTKEGLLYAGVILYRVIVFPMLYVITLNLVARTKSVIAGLAWAAGGVACVLGINVVMRMFKLMSYKQWNYGWDILVIAAVLGASFVLLKMFRRSLKLKTKAGMP